MLILSLLVIFATLVLAIVAAINVKRDSSSRLQGLEIVALGLYALWGFSLNGYLFNYDFDFLRALSEFYLIACACLFETRTHGRVVLGFGVVVLWISLAMRMAHELGVV